MNLCVVALCVVVVVSIPSTQAGVRPQDWTPSNIDRMLKNPKVVQKEIKCVLGKGSCDDIGRYLKEALPEVINRNCRKCNAQQYANARKITSFIQHNYPRDWQVIQARYKSG